MMTSRPPPKKMEVPNAPLVTCRISSGLMSATGYPIHFMCGSRVGFSGSEQGSGAGKLL